MDSGYVENLLVNLTDDFKKQWSITKTGYFTPKRIYYNGSYEYVVTKQFIVNILFPKFSPKRQQKILKRAKKLNIWTKNNNAFESIITQQYVTCKRGCKHLILNYWYECYDNQVEYTREYLKLNNISNNNIISIQDILSLTDIFNCLVLPNMSANLKTT